MGHLAVAFGHVIVWSFILKFLLLHLRYRIAKSLQHRAVLFGSHGSAKFCMLVLCVSLCVRTYADVGVIEQ